MPGLEVKDLTITAGPAGATVIDRLSFSVPAGGMTALVGESGSGKTMAARAILNLLPQPMRIAGGSIAFAGRELTTLSARDLRSVRGGEIGMIFQEPMVSLNPSMRIGAQLAEAMRLHLKLSPDEIRARCLDMLRRIQIADPEGCLRAWPHEFSGGMRQRIMIASVMLLRPGLLIADEPTTALDMLVAREVLDLMTELAAENGTSVLLISHDLGMVSRYVQDVVVLQQGRAVEAGAAGTVLTRPAHPYTRRLVEALPRRGPARAPAPDSPLIELHDVSIAYPGKSGPLRRAAPRTVVEGASLRVAPGETLALVGASGSGKTTLGRAIIGLAEPSRGSIRFRGEEIAGKGAAHRCKARRAMQMVFQDPFSSLDPRQRIGSIIAESLRHDPSIDAMARARETCTEVGLDPALMSRFPHQLSGGQRQRAAIARAIAPRPAFVVADEPVSALDMTVQRQILLLIRDLQDRLGFACLFISHDLGAVEQLADRVAVMEGGRIVETGSRDAVFDAPQHPYTRRLLGAAVRLDPVA